MTPGLIVVVVLPKIRIGKGVVIKTVVSSASVIAESTVAPVRSGFLNGKLSNTVNSASYRRTEVVPAVPVTRTGVMQEALV